MPWMRRFLPAPDGSVGQADRQQGPWVYVGILAASSVTLQIEQIVGSWFIPGGVIGERFTAGVAKNTNSVLAAESFAAGAIVAEGRFQ